MALCDVGADRTGGSDQLFGDSGSRIIALGKPPGQLDDVNGCVLSAIPNV
jgi:hypothetical protein